MGTMIVFALAVSLIVILVCIIQLHDASCRFTSGKNTDTSSNHMIHRTKYLSRERQMPRLRHGTKCFSCERQKPHIGHASKCFSCERQMPHVGHGTKCFSCDRTHIV